MAAVGCAAHCACYVYHGDERVLLAMGVMGAMGGNGAVEGKTCR